jgi:hypothetical protein
MTIRMGRSRHSRIGATSQCTGALSRHLPRERKSIPRHPRLASLPTVDLPSAVVRHDRAFNTAIACAPRIVGTRNPLTSSTPYRELVQALHDAGVSRNVYWVNVDAVLS